MILITTPERLKAQWDAFTRFLRILRQGIDVIHQRPTDARRIYIERTETDSDDTFMNGIFNATLPCFTYDLRMTRWYYDQLEGWMSDRRRIDAPEALVSYWTNDLVLSAREAMAHSATL